MVPKKIRPYFITTKETRDGNNSIVEGTLGCCDAHNFKIVVYGKVKRGFLSKMFLVPQDDKVALAVCCEDCGRIISVFDSSCDGYDCHENEQSLFFPTQVTECYRCHNVVFSAFIKYEYPDAKELEELEILEPDNAFTWIWISLKCNKCGAVYKDFLDYET